MISKEMIKRRKKAEEIYKKNLNALKKACSLLKGYGMSNADISKELGLYESTVRAWIEPRSEEWKKRYEEGKKRHLESMKKEVTK